MLAEEDFREIFRIATTDLGKVEDATEDERRRKRKK
jgi:hypothetical protein